MDCFPSLFIPGIPGDLRSERRNVDCPEPTEIHRITCWGIQQRYGDPTIYQALLVAARDTNWVRLLSALNEPWLQVVVGSNDHKSQLLAVELSAKVDG